MLNCRSKYVEGLSSPSIMFIINPNSMKTQENSWQDDIRDISLAVFVIGFQFLWLYSIVIDILA